MVNRRIKIKIDVIFESEDEEDRVNNEPILPIWLQTKRKLYFLKTPLKKSNCLVAGNTGQCTKES